MKEALTQVIKKVSVGRYGCVGQVFCYDSEKTVNNSKNEGEKRKRKGVGVGYCEENVK